MAHTITHDNNNSVDISLAAAPIQGADFGVIAILVPLATNTLGNPAVRTALYASSDDVSDAEGAGYISAGTAEMLNTIFGLPWAPSAVRLIRHDQDTQVSTVTFTAPTGDSDLTINGITVTYSSDGSPTADEHAAGLDAAIAAESDLSGVVTATAALGVLTVTAVEPGVVFTISCANDGETPAVATSTACEDGDDALDAAVAIADDFYGVATVLRTPLAIKNVAAWVESRRKLFCAQSADTDVVGTFPSELAILQTYEQTILVYHDSNSETAAETYLASRLVADPDLKSPGWRGAISGIEGYSAFTSSQKAAGLTNNVNLILPYGSESLFVHPGVNAKGRAVEEIVTKHWFSARIAERFARVDLEYAARMEKIPVTEKGAAILKAEVDALFAIGVRAGHFVEGQTFSEVVPVTSTMRDDREIAVTGKAQLAISGKTLSFTAAFGREPVIIVEE